MSALTTVPWSLFMRNMDFRRRAGGGGVPGPEPLRRHHRTGPGRLRGLGGHGRPAGGLRRAAGPDLVWRCASGRHSAGTPRSSSSCSPTPGAWPATGCSASWPSTATTSWSATGATTSTRLLPGLPAAGVRAWAPSSTRISAVLFPMYSRIRSEGREALREAMYRALRLVALFSIPVGVGLALVARDAFTVFYGTESDVGIRTMEVHLDRPAPSTGLGFATGDLLMAINRPGDPAAPEHGDGADHAGRHVVRGPPGHRVGGGGAPGDPGRVHRPPPDHRRPHHRRQRPDVGRSLLPGLVVAAVDHGMCAAGPPRHRHGVRVAGR